MSRELKGRWYNFIYPMSDAPVGNSAYSGRRLIRKTGDRFYQGVWVIKWKNNKQ